ncbi:MAG: DUF4978 domain-containing protein [Clostridia bacterium]|nr:DUF4978 domain-containing protein [Clostridia bacterium]
MKTSIKRQLAVLLCAAMLFSAAGSNVAAEGVTSLQNIIVGSRVAFNDSNYERDETLEVAGEPFFYNGVQIRIDKVVDDPAYNFSDEKIKQLFQIAKDDGFTVANVQIRWMDVQSDQMFYAEESAYIRGGSYADQTFNTGGIQTFYTPTDASEQALGYVKFDISAWSKSDAEAARLRLWHRNSLSSAYTIEIYALENNSWSKDSLTWNNAPEYGELLTSSVSWDKVASNEYYDFDVSAYVENACKNGQSEIGFVIKAPDAAEAVVFDDYDDNHAPQLYLSSKEEYDWEYLDKIIGYAEEVGIKLEILWFATDTCSIVSEIRLPYYVLSGYQKCVFSDGTPWFKKANSSVTGVYYYLMCKNDMALRAQEYTALQTVFDHIGQYNAEHGNKNTVIGCQVCNEPNVARLHNSGQYDSGKGEWLGACQCSKCQTLKTQMGFSTDSSFRDYVMFEYCNNLSKAVKQSDYPVWTRVNNVQGNDAWGVTYNENKRSSGGTDTDNGTYLDFIGLDPYGWDRSSLYGFGTGSYSTQSNLPMVMESGGEKSMSALMMLATVAGGAFYNVYDLCSSDGHHLYDKNLEPRVIGSGDKYLPDGGTYIEDVRNHNSWLNKIAYELATKKPEKLGGKNLLFFNCEGTDAASINVTKRIGGMDVIYNSDTIYSSGIAVKKSDNEIVLLSSKDTDASFTLSDVGSDIKTVEFGHYEGSAWVADDGDVSYQISGGDVVVTMPSFSVVRVETNSSLPNSAVFEAETTEYVVTGASQRTVTESSASAGKWLCLENNSVGASITFTINIPANMTAAQISTGYKSKSSGRGSLQLSVNGVDYADELSLTASEAFRATSYGPIVKLNAGQANTFTYTITKVGVIGLDYIELLKSSTLPDRLEGETLIDESFEIGGTFGFSSGASVSNGMLSITQQMGNYTTSVKNFDAKIVNQTQIDLSFDWKTNITSSGKKSGIEFRDTYGRLIFAIASKSGSELRHSTSGWDSDSSKCEYDWEPIWDSASMSRDKTYTVRLTADFASKLVSYSISEKSTGNIVAQNISLPTQATNFGKMIAANYYTNESGTSYTGTQDIDSFNLIGAGGKALPYRDKVIYAFGDSIVDGHVYQKMGFVEFFALQEGMLLSHNGAVNGAAVVNGSIKSQIEAAPEEEPDLVILDGGINDAYASTDMNAFKTEFQALATAIKTKWSSAAVVYVAVHKTAARTLDSQAAVRNAAIAICQAEGFMIADVYEDSTLDTNNSEMRWNYSFNELGFDNLPGTMATTSSEKYNDTYPSGTHPNFRAIEEFYIPALTDTVYLNWLVSDQSIAYGKTAYATAEENGNGNYSPAENAIDGDYTTKYSSYQWDGSNNVSTLPQAIMIDLGKEMEITSVSSYWYGSDRSYLYDLYITNNPTVENTVFTKPGKFAAAFESLSARSSGTSKGTLRNMQRFASPARGRYVTLFVTEASSAAAASIFEIVVNGREISNGFTASASVENGVISVQASGEGQFIAAAYANNSTLLSAKFFDTNTQIPLTTNMSKLIVFSWSSIDTLIPVGPCCEYLISEISAAES